jgi:hypothetical protein
MGRRIIYERYVWFDAAIRKGTYPNASALAREFELSVKTAQRDVDFMRDRLNCPLVYDKSRKGYYYRDGSSPAHVRVVSSLWTQNLLGSELLVRGLGQPTTSLTTEGQAKSSWPL